MIAKAGFTPKILGGRLSEQKQVAIREVTGGAEVIKREITHLLPVAKYLNASRSIEIAPRVVWRFRDKLLVFDEYVKHQQEPDIILGLQETEIWAS